MPESRPRLRKSITFERGLNEYFEESMLPEGALPRLRNWESSPTGELRARAGWLRGSLTSAPAAPKGVGIGYFTRLITPGVVQQSTVGTATTTPVSVSWGGPTVKGNLLVLVVTAHHTGAGDADITTPTGWTEAIKSSAGEPKSAIYYKANAAPESGTVSVTLTLSEAATAQLFEVNQITLTSPLDKTAENTGTSATVSSGTTAATVQAVEFVIAALADGRLETQTSPTNSFQKLSETQVDGVPDLTTGVYYKTTMATGTQTVSATTATSDLFAGVIAAFKGWFTTVPSAGQTGVTRFLVAQNDTTEYDIFSLDRENLSAGTWSNIGSVTATDPTKFVAFAPGFGKTWFTNEQFASLQYYDGVSITAPMSTPAGRCVAVHKNRVWVAGTSGAPGRLYFSNPNDGTTFSTLDFLDIASEDGEPIEDIVPQQDVLVIGKRTGLWVLTGSGLDNFVLRKLAIGGLAPGRTLMPTPYGTIAVGRANIWLINGTEVTRISLPVTRSFLYTSGYLTASYIDDTCYICDSSSGQMWALNMQTGTWREERLSSITTEGPAAVYNHDQTQVFTPKNATVGSLLNYRDFPMTSRLKDFDTLTEVFSAQTGLIFPVGPEEAFTPKHLYLRIRQHGGNAGQAGMTVTPQYRRQNGTSVSGTVHTVVPKASASVFRERIDLGNRSGISGVRFDFDQTLGTTDDTTMDIEEATFEFDVERIR